MKKITRTLLSCVLLFVLMAQFTLPVLASAQPLSTDSTAATQTEVTIKESMVHITVRQLKYIHAKGPSKLTYRSSNPSVATVNSYGGIKGIKAGKAVIHVTSKGKRATCTVYVGPALKSMKAKRNSVTTYPGATEQLDNTFVPAKPRDTTVIWTSRDPSIATVDATGLVRVQKLGTTSIMATSQDGTKRTWCKIIVKPAIKSVALDYSKISLKEGRRAQLTATISPADAYSKNITWKSTNVKVATVDQTGIVTAVGEGWTSISATTDNKKVARCGVTVSGLKVILQNPGLPNGAEATLLANLLSYYGFNPDKIALAKTFIPKTDFTTKSGVKYGPDPNVAFAGDPTATTGYYCFAPPVVSGANTYLTQNKSNLRAKDITGSTQATLDNLINNGTPVIMWVATGYNNKALYSSSTWKLPTGATYKPYSNLTCVMVYGLNNTSYLVIDPIKGKTTVGRQTLYASYSAMGNRAMVIP